MIIHFFFLQGVRLSGGDTDQLHLGDSLCGAAASGPQHLLPAMDSLAYLLRTLEPRHDRFPLLQSCKDLTGISPDGTASTRLLIRKWSCFLFIYVKVFSFVFVQEKNDRPFVAVCKKCIIPKPARTHHCGICNR